MGMGLNQLTSILGITEGAEQVAYIGLAVGCLIIVVARALICSVYMSQRGLLKVNGKEIKKKDEIKSIKKFPMLVKLAKEYQRIGDKGIANIDTRALVERHVSNLSLLGWSYVSMENFVSSLEQAIPLIGLIFLFVFNNSLAFGLFSVIAFLLLKIFSALFDFGLSRNKLVYDLVEYLDREIGQFYVGDFSSAIQRLKVELIGGITNQAAVMSQSIDKLGNDLSVSFAEGIGRMAASFDGAVEKFASYAQVMEAPLDQWKEAVSQAYDAQAQMNAAAYHLNDTVAGMQNAMDGVQETFEHAIGALKDSIQTYTLNATDHMETIKEVLQELIAANQGIQGQYDHVNELNEAVEAQLDYIQDNQKLLDQTVHSYEQGLQSFTSSLSEGFGSIISFHVEDAYKRLNDELQENIKQITMSNTEVVGRIEKFFQQIAEQSKGEMQVLFTMKEQMDIHFDRLNKTVNEKQRR